MSNYYNPGYEDAHKCEQLTDLENQGFFFWEDGNWNLLAINIEANTFIELKWIQEEKKYSLSELKNINDAEDLKNQILEKIEIETRSK